MAPINMEDVISSVRKNPCLWDRHHKFYCDKASRDKAWEQVVKEAVPSWDETDEDDKRITLMEVKRKWNNVRDYYRRELNDIKYNKSRRRTRKYVYFDILNFLKHSFSDPKVAKYRESDEEIEEATYLEDDALDEDISDFKTERFEDVDVLDSTDALAEQVAAGKEYGGGGAAYMDDDLAFFKCLLPDIKKLDDEKKFDFKLETMKLLKRFMSSQAVSND